MKKGMIILAVFFLLYGAGENWTLLSPGGTPPSGRWGAASVYDSLADRFIVWGGGRWGVVYNDLYALDSTATGNGVWIPLSQSGTIPPAKHLMSYVYDAPRRRMIIFCGYNQAGGCDNEVYFLDSIFSSTPHWTHPSISGTPPIYRQSSAAAYDPIQERMIVFSGWCGYNWRNDVWVLENLDTTPTWRQLFPSGTGPGGRWGATCIYDSDNDCLIVFGGMNTSMTYPNDVWALESLQIGDGHWTQLSPGGSPPPGRMWPVSAWDYPNDRMLLFGGGYFQSSQFNDLWSLDPLSSSPSWTLINASGSNPTVRTAPSLAHDKLRHRLIVFGGNDVYNYNDVYTLTWSVGVSEGTAPTINRPVVSVKPNPFHCYTTINFESSKGLVSSMKVFDSQGRLIKRYSPDNEKLPTRIVWDGKDTKGSEVSSGTYFLVVETNEGKILKRVVKIR